MPRRHAFAFAGALIFALALPLARPASAAPGHRPVTFTGTWQVSRTCTAGCSGTTIAIELVSTFSQNVYAVSGSTAMVLYVIGKQVLVHAAKSTTLLTIKTPGRLMSGSGIASDGSVFVDTWTWKHA